MKKYKIYYIDNSNRIEGMLTLSLHTKINWLQEGLKIVSWKYNLIFEGQEQDLNKIFKKHSILNIDKRKKKQLRTINISDIIEFDGIAWIVSAFGFIKIPDILWKKISI